MNNEERPIAAIATALAPAAIAAIRVSGRDSLELLARRFSRPRRLRAAAGHTLHHGEIVDGDGIAVDEVLVAVYRAPRSYTGEEAAEVFCHGSPAGVRRVLSVLLQAGFAVAEPGEFTRRAFINGKVDLTRAEAVNELVHAQTTTAHALALDRLGGSVERAAGSLRAELVAVMAQLAIQLDYPEEETGAIAVDADRLRLAGRTARELAASFDRGRLYQEGVRVALAGRTNAGKSALFNCLLRQDRSIVSEVHGTTRDYVEALIDVDGIPVRLFDTAGLRVAGEEVEEEGIRRSRTIIAAADLVLYVVDAAIGQTDEDADRLREISELTPAIVALNKSDLLESGDSAGIGTTPARGSRGREEVSAGRTARVAAVPVSAREGTGIDRLNDAIVAALLDDAGATGGGQVIIDSERQHALLIRAANAIDETLGSLASGLSADAVAVDLQEALDAVGEITGEVASAEILDAMFTGFCVGK